MKKHRAIILFASLIIAMILLNSCNFNETNSSNTNTITPFVVSVDSSSTNDVPSYSINSTYTNSVSSTPNPSNLSNTNDVNSYTSSDNISRTNSASSNLNSVGSSETAGVPLYPDSTDSSNKEDETLIFESMMTMYYSTCTLGLKWEELIEIDVRNLYARYEVGTAVIFHYSVHSNLDADEFQITCEGENIRLVSPAKCRIKNLGVYQLELYAPETGSGKVVITLTALKDGKAINDDVHSYFYWSSCDLGIYVSSSEPVPELMMAKAQYDAGKITSLAYYKILRNQYFVIDLELLGMLQRTASDNPNISPYAAPYIEAVHNSIFEIKSDAKIPTVSETLEKIKNDLGIDFTGEAARKNKISSG